MIWRALVLLLLLGGCTTAVTMRHPDGRVVKCGPYDARPINSFSSAQREQSCIQDYQRQGFERAPE